MVQIIQENRKPSLSERLASGLGRGLEIGTNFLLDRQRRQALQEAGIPSDLPEDLQKTYLSEKLRGESKQNILAQKMKALGLGGDETKPRISSFAETLKQDLQGHEKDFRRTESQEIEDRFPSDEEIARHALIDPNFARIERAEKDAALKEKRSVRKEKRQEFEKDREYHSQISRPIIKEAEQVLAAAPLKNGIMNQWRRDISSGNTSGLGQFMAEKTGAEFWRTPEAARFKAAGKEYFIENLRTLAPGAKPNIFIEQQLAGAQPTLGRDIESGLTVLEMQQFLDDLKTKQAELEMKNAEEDTQKFGFAKDDIKTRARKEIVNYANERQNALAYNIRKIHEDQMNDEQLTNEIFAKKIPSDTPLTERMAQILMIKNNDNVDAAIREAQRLGFQLPRKK